MSDSEKPTEGAQDDPNDRQPPGRRQIMVVSVIVTDPVIIGGKCQYEVFANSSCQTFEEGLAALEGIRNFAVTGIKETVMQEQERQKRLHIQLGGTIPSLPKGPRPA